MRSAGAENPAPLEEVLLIKHLWGHHSKLGGSGILCDYLPAPVLCASDYPFGDSPHGTARWNLGRKIFDAMILGRAPCYRLIHFIHAENHPGLLFRMARAVHRAIRLLGTIHLPLDYYSLQRSLAALGRLDGIISLATHQVEQVRELLPRARVWHVPCGFEMDHAFRRPDLQPATDRFQAAVIGSNYRDWDALSAILKAASEKFPDWRFPLLGIPGSRKESFRNFPNAVVHPRLDDQEYFDVLAASHVLLLPLTWATNNTAVLEGYSVGLPTLCTDLPSIRDYAVSTTQTFKTVEQALDLLYRHSRLSKGEHAALRETTRAEGRRFHWKNIARQVTGIYRELLEGN